MKKSFGLVIIFVAIHSLLVAQGVGIGATEPHSSAMLDVQATNKGILIPRLLQSQRVAIVSPAQSLMVYQTDVDTGFYYFQGQEWKNLTNKKANNPGSIIIYNRYTKDGPDEIWRSNIDGSGQQKIDIVLPQGLVLDLSDGGEIKITPDNKKIIFKVTNLNSTQDFYYSCSIDGSNVTKIIEGPIGGGMELGAVN